MEQKQIEAMLLAIYQEVFKDNPAAKPVKRISVPKKEMKTEKHYERTAAQTHAILTSKANNKIKDDISAQRAFSRAAKKRDSTPYDYDKINSEFIAGSSKQISVTLPNWMLDLLKEQKIDVRPAIRASLAASLGVNLRKIHCTKSNFGG